MKRGPPIINLDPLLDRDKYKNAIEEIGEACKDWGFFLIESHGIPRDLIHRFRQSSVSLFSTDRKALDKIRRTGENSRGYFDDELTKRKLDWKKCFDFGCQDGSLETAGMDGYNQWPDNMMLSEFKHVMYAYFAEMEKLAKRLLRAISLSLGWEPGLLLDTLMENLHTSFLRLNFYPVCPVEQLEGTLGIHPHTDAGALTVLYQDESVTSLQVLYGGKWVSIDPVADTFVVNIGDMIQGDFSMIQTRLVFSNDTYKAPVHRVLPKSDSERLSAAFFYNPGYEAIIAPLCVERHTSVYRPINWGEFRRKRFEGDYADVGEEVQIKMYRV